MTLDESLKLERYKLVTDRQKYFTELARDAFASYTKFLAALAAGGITLISTRTKLELRTEILVYVVHGIVYLSNFSGRHCICANRLLPRKVVRVSESRTGNLF